MKITIVYDNTAWDRRLVPDWGFACLVAAAGKKILFDTGARGDILLANMAALGIDPRDIDFVFISHDHWDHTGGLLSFLSVNPVKVYLPETFQPVRFKAVRVAEPYQLSEGLCSTGELENIEQSLLIRDAGGITVIAGCSHPGVETILSKASETGPVKNLVGGLHGFSDFEKLTPLDRVCPTHCTRHIAEIQNRFPDKYVQGGAGKTIAL